MLTIEQIKEGLGDKVLAEVTRQTGVNRQTLWEIRAGKRTNIQYKTMQALSEYLGNAE